MRHLKVVTLAAATALVVVASAQGAYLDDTIKALKRSPVYVALGTPGTDADTTGVLLSQLTAKDNTFIVMLPAAAIEETDGDINAFVRKLDAATGRQRIFGLAIGEQLVGFSSVLPAGVATDLMNRAIDVSTNPVETLGTYITNVQGWLSEHPQPVPPKPKPKPQIEKKDEGLHWLFWLLISVGGLGLLMLLARGVVSTTSAQDPDRIELRSAPDPVKDGLQRLNKWREDIQDRELTTTIVQLCRDADEYFRRFGKQDEDKWVSDLACLNAVLEKYVDIQNAPRYYDTPSESMRSGKEAVSGFAAKVLSSIKRGNRRALMDFNVDTDILSAQKYA